MFYYTSTMFKIQYFTQDAIENKAVFINEVTGIPVMRTSPVYRDALGGEMLYAAKEPVFNL